jgi:hypothetical protein
MIFGKYSVVWKPNNTFTLKYPNSNNNHIGSFIMKEKYGIQLKQT